MKKRWLKLGSLTVIGGALGFAYYYFIGCHTGTCAITSNPVNSTAYGMLIGLVWGFGGRGDNAGKSES